MNSQDASHAYTSSIAYDRRLYSQDIAGSVAHVRMLAKQGVVTDDEAERIVTGLGAILREMEEDTFPWREELEDIHMNVEARLREIVGEAAGKLHTARSRNDQVATDLRLYVMEAARASIGRIRALQGALLDQAEGHVDTVLPGYTHLQRAQPVVLAHHLLAYVQMLERDAERFAQARQRADVLPLGSGALAGSPYPLDREFVARELGFSRVSENSMDAVSDRDFVLDYLSAAAVAMAHLSRLAEELVLWSSEEFGFVRLADSHTTGSSMMPQKRNPDLAELGRGRTGRVYGNLMAMLTTLKGLPLTYNRDLQEDKEGLFDTVDTLDSALEAFRRMLAGARFSRERMAAATGAGYLLATDLADYLVKRGVPFREAHGAVVELTRYAVDQGKGYGELSLDEYRRFSPAFDSSVYAVTVQSSVAARNVVGGTAPERVAEALRAARARLTGHVA
jgi:argininosuccinate lyase